MADTDVQGMLVRIEATTAQLRQEIARGESAVAKASSKMDGSLGVVDKAFDRTGANASVLQRSVSSAFTGMGLAATAAIAGLVAITTKTTEYAQEVRNLSTLSNTSTTEFQRMAAGARTVGVEQEKLADIYKDTTDRAGEFIARGGGEMADFFKEIAPRVGVTAQMFANLSGPQALQLYYNSLEKAGLNQQQMTTYMEAMADEATALIPLLKNNGQGFKQLGDEAEAAGNILSNIQISRLVQVNQSIKALEASFAGASRQLVAGMLPGIESVTQRLNAMSKNGVTEGLGAGIAFLADNLNILAAVLGGKVAASFAGYLTTLTTSTLASVQSRSANIAQAASAVEVASANQIAAQSATIRAEREAIAARGTAVQTQMSIQLAQARMSERAATAQVAAAQATLKGASTGVLALLGGPAGIAALAVSAGIAFLTMRDSTVEVSSSLNALKRPLQEIREEFRKLTQDQQGAELVKIARDQERAITAADAAYGDFLKTVNQKLGSTVGTRVSGEFDAARTSGAQLSTVVDDLAKRFHIPEDGLRSIRESAGAFSEADQAAAKLTKTQTELIKLMAGAPEGSKAPDNSASVNAGNTYLQQLDKQLQTIKDKTTLEQAETLILKEKIDTESALAASIRARAKAIDERKAADAAAAKAESKNATESASAAKQQLKSFDTAEEGYQRQIELLNTTGDKQKDATEAMKLSFELQEGKLGKLSEAQKKKLMGMAAELDALNKLKKANEDDLKLTAFKNAQALNTQTTKDGFDQELAGVGMGDKARDRMRADLAMRQKYAADVASLNEQRNTGQISPELYANETQVLEDELAKRLQAQQDFYDATDVQQQNWMNGVNEAWANYAAAAADYSAQAADLTNTALQSGTSELGTFFSDVASGAEDAGDALGDMVGNFAKSMLKALGDMAAQWLIYQGIQMLVGKSTQSSSAVMLGANAQAMSLQAGLNAYASTAAIPIIGPAAAPAAMAAALTVTQPLASAVGMTALAGMAHDGIDSVPEDGSWFLQKGERVTTAQTSAKLDAMLSRIDSSLSSAQPQAQIGVGSLESIGNGRAAMVGTGDSSSGDASSAGPSQIIFSAPVTVQAQPGMSSQDAQMQGDSIGAALEARMGKFLDVEMRQGGRLWRR